MTQKNLVLTEKAIARHTKRLQHEMKKINQDLKLSEAQNMLARILGMKDYHELKIILNIEYAEEINTSNIIKNKIIPEKYKKNAITQKRENMLEHILLTDVEVLKYSISKEFISLVDLIISSNKEEVAHFIANHTIDINYQIPGRNWQAKNIFEFAVFFDQYDILKYLLTLDNINLENIQEYLIKSVALDNIDMLKYLCKKLPYTQQTLDAALLYTSDRDLDNLKFLLTSRELKFNANIHYKKDECLKIAINHGKLEIVKYLLTSEELVDKPSLFTTSWRDNVTDIRDDIAYKIKMYNGKLKRPNGDIIQINFTQSEKNDFFNVLSYLVNDYADKKLLHWLYINAEIRPYINKEKIDIEYLLSLMEKK